MLIGTRITHDVDSLRMTMDYVWRYGPRFGNDGRARRMPATNLRFPTPQGRGLSRTDDMALV